MNSIVLRLTAASGFYGKAELLQYPQKNLSRAAFEICIAQRCFCRRVDILQKLGLIREEGF